MRRIAFGVFVILLASCAMSTCGDDGGDEKEVSPEENVLGAAEFETFCDAVVEYATATVPPGAPTENQAALRAVVEVLLDEQASDHDEESGRVLRECGDRLLNVLQRAATPGP